METIQIKIGGLHCPGCVRNITNLLSAIDGVKKTDVSLQNGTATITYDPAATDTSRFSTVIENAGFDVRG